MISHMGKTFRLASANSSNSEQLDKLLALSVQYEKSGVMFTWCCDC